MTTSALPTMATSAMTETATMLGVTDGLIWLLVVGFVAAFILAFSVGGNDVANSFGTTVGSKVLTLRQACILGTVFEIAGAVLIGAKVGEMIRKGIIDVEVYDVENGATLLMMGEVAAMFGSGIWQLIATYFKLPVSGTHAIVGACIGFSLVAIGSDGVRWSNIGFVVASWFISPALSGAMAVLLYYFVKRFIIETENPLKNGLKMLPLFYAVAVGLNLFSVLYTGAPLLGLDHIPVWGIVLIAFSGMILVAIVIKCYTVPKLRRTSEHMDETIEYMKSSNDVENACRAGSSSEPVTSSPYLSSSRSEESIKSETNSFRSEGSFESEKSDFKKKKTFSQQLRERRVHFEEKLYKDNSDRKTMKEKINDFSVQLLTSSDSLTSIDESESFDEKIDNEVVSIKSSEETKKEKEEINPEEDDEDPETVRQLFSSIQILTACFGSFAHGGNDVSNAIGPLIALWIIFSSGSVAQTAFTPWYLLLYGGVGISAGLWLMGKRVIETIGKDLTKVTPSRGFCIELMTAVTVLVASNLGIPISTTHCKVGAVISIGWYRSRAAVQWSIVRNIAFAWFITLPVAGLFGAAAMYILMQFI